MPWIVFLSLVVIVCETTAASWCPSASGPAVSQPLGTVVFGADSSELSEKLPPLSETVSNGLGPSRVKSAAEKSPLSARRMCWSMVRAP